MYPPFDRSHKRTHITDLQAGPHVPRNAAAAAAAVSGTDAAVDYTVPGTAASAAPAAVSSRRAAAVTRGRRTAAVCAASGAGAAPIPNDVSTDTGAAAAGATVLPECRQPAAAPSAARGADAATQSHAVVVVAVVVAVVCGGDVDNKGDELTKRFGRVCGLADCELGVQNTKMNLYVYPGTEHQKFRRRRTTIVELKAVKSLTYK